MQKVQSRPVNKGPQGHWPVVWSHWT